jgi:hypothetical protein
MVDMSLNTEFIFHLYNTYELYRENSLNRRTITHGEVVALINNIRRWPGWNVSPAGYSELGKEINMLSTGSGPIKIFLWSQMHGDESTATRSIFDIINFMTNPTGYHHIIDDIRLRTTIYFLPMVNPDGAELFQRRNAYGIDINRDVLQQSSSEAKILMEVFDSIRPDYAFNLHDQSTLYSVEHSEKQVALSFLAPPFDYEQTVNLNRERAMQVVVAMKKAAECFMPEHIARYCDDFEPRAFGDTFQLKGASTILVESGGWKDDTEKDFLRKNNVIVLLSAIHDIAKNIIPQYTTDEYFKIPENAHFLFDVLLKDVKLRINDRLMPLDIGINYSEILCPQDRTFLYSGKIEDMGDLSLFHGIEEFILSDYEILPETIHPETLSAKNLKNLDVESLLKNGTMGVVVKDVEEVPEFYKFPLNIYSADKQLNFLNLKVGEPANFRLHKGIGEEILVINGYLFDLKTNSGTVRNAVIVR